MNNTKHILLEFWLIMFVGIVIVYVISHMVGIIFNKESFLITFIVGSWILMSWFIFAMLLEDRKRNEKE